MFRLALPTLILFQGCLDFQAAHVGVGSNANFAPAIDKRYVSPAPSAFQRRIPIAQNCKALEFKIPPIRDFNKEDALYYLWFFDGMLLPPYQGFIEPENRDRAIISLRLDRQAIEDAIGRSPLDSTFFETSHLLEFFVSDRPYTIPSSRFSDRPEAGEDTVYWSIWFSDIPCAL